MPLITSKYPGRVTPLGVDTQTWVCPAGVFFLTDVLGLGGGARGGNAVDAGARGGGGSGGCLVHKSMVPVVPGTSYTIKIPNNSALDADGADAELFDGATCLMRAKGGKKGGNAAAGSLSGAAGIADTTGCIGDVIFAGGDGSAGLASTRSGAGGGGAGTEGEGGDASGITAGQGTDTHGGNGGSGSTSGAGVNGSNGQAFGGGGGGARAADATPRTGGIGARGIVVLVYEVPDDLTPSSAAYCDDFTGGDDPDIDGRTLDGCGGTPGATWNRDESYNSVGDNLKILDGTAGGNDDEEIHYLVDGAACADPGVLNYQGARATLRFPNYDVPGSPAICTLIWQDEFDGVSGPLEGRSHSGGSAGTGTYQRIDSVAGSSPSGAELDGSGSVGVPDLGVAGYQIDGLVLPTNYDIIIDVERVPGPSAGSVGVTARGDDLYPAGADQQGRSNYGLTYSTHNEAPLAVDKYALWRGWVGEDSVFGTIITGSAAADPPGDHGVDEGDTIALRYQLRPGATNPGKQMWTYVNHDTNATPCNAGWKAAAGTEDCQFGGVCLNNLTGLVGIRWQAGASTPLPAGVNNYRIKRIRIYQYDAAVFSTVFTDSWVNVLLRGNEAEGRAYWVQLEGARVSASVFELYTRIVETNHLLRDARRVTEVPNLMDTDYTLTGEIKNDVVTGHPTIYVRVNGVLVDRFDTVSDIVETGGVGPLPGGNQYTDGNVGLGVFDSNQFSPDFNRAVIVKRFEVLCPAPEVCVPCTTGRALYAVDAFSGADVADIEARPFDGGIYAALLAGHGLWSQVLGDAIGLVGGAGVQVAAGPPVFTVYSATDATLSGRRQAIRAAFTIDHFTTPASEIALYTHLDPSGDGYRIRISLGETATLYFLEVVLGGIPTVLLSWDSAVDSVPLLGVGPHVVGQCAECEGNVTTLLSTIDGTELGTDDDEQLASGVTGVGILDQDAATTPSLLLTRVDLIGCATGAPGGDGGGGGGGETPIARIWVRRNLGWRLTMPEEQLQIRRNLLSRPFIRGAVRANLLWRDLSSGTTPGHVHGDPGDHIPNAGCGVAPATTVPLDPIGDRMFAAYRMPPEGQTGAFETALIAFGGWSVGHMALLQAAGKRLISGQGGYAKFFTNGTYVVGGDVYEEWLSSLAYLEPLVFPYFQAGTFLGIQVIDDHYWPPVWGGAHIDTNEVNRLCGLWKYYFPWMRTFVRAEPRFLDDGGSVSNMDVTICQYEIGRGNIANWAAGELATKNALGIPEILWSYNIYHAGDGTSGIVTGPGQFCVAPSEYQAKASIIAEQTESIGMAHWMYHPTVLNQPGMMDAFAAVRNIMVATP